MNNFRYDCEGVVLLIKSGILMEVLCYCNNKSAVKNHCVFRYYVAVAQRPKFKQNHTKSPYFYKGISV